MNNEFENKHISFSGEMKKDGIYEMAQEAIKLGADYLVIGRPIVESNNPLKTIKEINKSINEK